MFYRMCALIILLNGWDLSRSDTTWRWIIGIIVLVIGVELFSEATLRWDRRKEMPYHWTCPICKKRGKPTWMDSSEEFVINNFRDDHNRTVHLMEP